MMGEAVCNSLTVCLPSPQKDVKDVFTGIAFEVAYSLGKHMLTGHQEQELPALTPVLRWRKGNNIAVRNEVSHFSCHDACLNIFHQKRRKSLKGFSVSFVLGEKTIGEGDHVTLTLT